MSAEFSGRLHAVVHGSKTYNEVEGAEIVEITTYLASVAGGRLAPVRMLRGVDYAASVTFRKLSGAPAVGGAPVDFQMKLYTNDATPAEVTITCKSLVVADGGYDANGDVMKMTRKFLFSGTYDGTQLTEASA